MYDNQTLQEALEEINARRPEYLNDYEYLKAVDELFREWSEILLGGTSND